MNSRQKLTQKELTEILNEHRANNTSIHLTDVDLSELDLFEADLRHAELTNVNLHYADLSGANMRHAQLRYVDLSNVGLEGADLTEAVLFNVNLSHADLTKAVLVDATLENVNLHDAALNSANFYNAQMSRVNLKDAEISIDTIGIAPMCPLEGSFIAYKQAQDQIVVLEIPADARRSSATTHKCRCDKAKVLRIENLDGTPCDDESVQSYYNSRFIYTVGETLYIDNFDTNRWNECSTGIHFFMARDMAVAYEF